ncbi:MAG: hypothetical protein ACTS1Z_11105 [Parasphingopyxis sp.]
MGYIFIEHFVLESGITMGSRCSAGHQADLLPFGRLRSELLRNKAQGEIPAIVVERGLVEGAKE